MAEFVPGYVKLYESGELARRMHAAHERLAYCDLCPRQCHVDRLSGIVGACRTGLRARVHSYAPHMGEEAPLVGSGGSGTIFFACCNLACQYCQNYEISQLDQGQSVGPIDLAGVMLALQDQGCHNINLVSPTHVVAQILDALVIAIELGLRLPLVYNSGGYDALSTLALLDGVVDIYMPDMKYADAVVGQRLSGVPDYVEANQAAIIEMHRQVGDLVIDKDGVARRGLLVRHLVLPNDLAGTAVAMRFLADQVSPQTYVNVMSQYQPYYHASELEGLERPVAWNEYELAVWAALDAGLMRLDRPQGQRKVRR